MVKIRNYKSSDKEMVFHINRENQYFGEPNFQKYFKKDFDKYVAIIDQVVGWLVIKPKEFYIDFIIVDPDYKGQGIGKALMQYAEKLAKKKRLTKIVLDTRSNNKHAQRFYEKNGYKKTSEWVNQFKEKMFKYEKIL